MSVLALIAFVISQLFQTTTTVVTTDSKRMDADQQIRPLIDRIGIDIARMVKRSDVDYYLKEAGNPQPGNDQIAFFSAVPGYYPGSGSQSPLSVVGYRLNPQTGFERLGKGLLWNGVSPSDIPIVFLPLTISTNWPTATNASADADYEPLARQVFRFEYSYLLRSGALTDTPWDTAVGHTKVDGFRDVAAIAIAVAVLDARSRMLLSSTQMSDLTDKLVDFQSSSTAGDLVRDWQTAVDTTTTMPRAALSAVRIYERYFVVSP